MKKFIPLILFAFSLAVRLVGIVGVDEAWDEVPVVRYGEQYLNFVKNLDFSRETWKLNKEHPPFSKYFYGATRLVSLNVPLFRDKLDQDYTIGRRYTFQRIVSAILGSLTVVLVYLFGKNILGRRRIGVVSSLILSLIPYVIAHNRIATQETLVCFLLTLATYLFARGCRGGFQEGSTLKRVEPSSLYFITTGMVLGLAISTKYNSLLFLAFYAAVALIFFGRDFLKSPRAIFKNHIILIPFLAVGVLVLVWPWLWSKPLTQFLDSLSRIESSRFQEYFLGTFGEQPPWYYFFVYFVATTPPVLLVLLCLFGFCLLKGSTLLRVEPSWTWFVLFWFLTPFLASFMPLRQDGIRYIFPMYPALALACGLGLEFLSGQFLRARLLGPGSGGVSEPGPGAPKAWLFSLVSLAGPLITVSCLLITVIRFYPYYLDYYNPLVGGPQQVYTKRMFDFGYWGEGVRAAVGWVNQNAESGTTIGFNFAPRHVAPNLRGDLKLEENSETADYIIWNVEGEWRGVPTPDPSSYDIVYTEGVTGVPLVMVSRKIYN